MGLPASAGYKLYQLFGWNNVAIVPANIFAKAAEASAKTLKGP